MLLVIFSCVTNYPKAKWPNQGVKFYYLLLSVSRVTELSGCTLKCLMRMSLGCWSGFLSSQEFAFIVGHSQDEKMVLIVGVSSSGESFQGCLCTPTK